jgi:hypothetical protein
MRNRLLVTGAALVLAGTLSAATPPPPFAIWITLQGHAPIQRGHYPSLAACQETLGKTHMKGSMWEEPHR